MMTTTWAVHMLLSFIQQATPDPAPVQDSSGIDLNNIVTLLIGAGGAGLIAAAVSAYRTWKKGRLEDEETLIARLNADSKSQGDRADAAEARVTEIRDQSDRLAAQLRHERDSARDTVAYYRQLLIQYQIPFGPVPGQEHSQGYGGQHRGQ